jgi:hypothetical protein
VPIIERTPQQCFDVFTDHLRELVAATVTRRYPLAGIVSAKGSRLSLSFREVTPIAVPIETDYGRLFFYLGQAHEAVPHEGGGYRLTTRQYWYRLQHGPAVDSPAAIRWEYDRDTRRDHHARHHAQSAAAMALGDRTLDLNKAHLPTGWVTIEEVIRFLVHDLGMRPPCGNDWCDRIIESEDRFFTKFTGKRYVAPQPLDSN